MKDGLKRGEILIVDDDDFTRRQLSHIISSNGYHPLEASDAEEGFRLLQQNRPDLLITDLVMPGISGQELLQRVVYSHPEIPVLVVSARDTIETAVECMRLGAFDYLLKPVSGERLLSCVNRSLEFSMLKQELRTLRHRLITGELQNGEAFSGIVTGNRKMKRLFQYLEAVAVSDQPVLITGETGTGKELFARAVHKLSGRPGEFIAINMAGLDDQVFSDTLFGHKKGAFTSADSSREGVISRAEHGTLFLDEIGDIPLASQTRLLRLLQEKEYFPLGSDHPRRGSCRIVAATNRNLLAMTKTGSFRNDLYYRLSGHHCHLPPLRERMDDLPLLLEHFIIQAADKLGKEPPEYQHGLVSLLSAYPFPGNLRELQALVFDAVAQHGKGLLKPTTFLQKIRQLPEDAVKGTDCKLGSGVAPPPRFDNFPTLKEAEKMLIEQALALADGNQGVAASLLGISRTALNNRLVRGKGTKTAPVS